MNQARRPTQKLGRRTDSLDRLRPTSEVTVDRGLPSPGSRYFGDTLGKLGRSFSVSTPTGPMTLWGPTGVAKAYQRWGGFAFLVLGTISAIDSDGRRLSDHAADCAVYKMAEAAMAIPVRTRALALHEGRAAGFCPVFRSWEVNETLRESPEATKE